MFSSVLDTAGITLASALTCTGVSIALGFVIAFVYLYKSQCSKHFAITLVLLPVIVQTVILMVNGNLGAGVAVAGAFSLIRFRSVPGTSKEIVSIFYAMAVGLATGMGYIGYAVLIAFVIGAVMLLLSATSFGEQAIKEKELTVTIPENLDYVGLLEDLFCQYTNRHDLIRVKTVSMGSLYELRYRVTLKDENREKEMLDAIRERNGNLKIACGRVEMAEQL